MTHTTQQWHNNNFNFPCPKNIQRIAVRICSSYGIRGICDAPYIANIIAFELGLGDGQSDFTEEAWANQDKGGENA